MLLALYELGKDLSHLTPGGGREKQRKGTGDGLS